MNWRFSFCLALAFLSCSSFSMGADKVIQTVNYPLAYFAERILGEEIGKSVELRFEAPPEIDPAFWKPGEDAVIAFQNADLILDNGTDYASWMKSFSLPRSIIANTSAAFESDYLVMKGGLEHSHGNGEVHSHDGTAFTTWLDFGQAKRQAEAVLVALVKLLPHTEDELRKKAEDLFADLEALNREMKRIGKDLEGIPLVASHPVYQYLERAYGLSLKSVHWEPDTVPVGEPVKELEQVLAEHEAKWMLWEGAPGSVAVEFLEEKGIGSVVFDPCANRPEDGDWLSVMRSNLETLDEVATFVRKN
ncbi:MAG: metal ABC transporter substrate-binding protein [Verrucomicrobiota bacterium]